MERTSKATASLHFAGLCLTLALLGAAVNLTARSGDWYGFYRFSGGILAMDEDAAMCCMLLSLSGLLLLGRWRVLRWVAPVPAAFAVAIAVGSGGCRLVNPMDYLDELLRFGGQTVTAPPAMTPATALSIILLGASLLLRGCSSNFFIVQEAVCYPVIGIMLLVLNCYAYGVAHLVEPSVLSHTYNTKMSCFDSLVLLVLSLAVLALDTKHWCVRRLAQPQRGALMLRLLLPGLLGMPIALASLKQTVVLAGWLDDQLGSALLVIFSLTLVCGLAVHVSAMIDAADMAADLQRKKREQLLYAVAHRMTVALNGADRTIACLAERVDAKTARILSTMRWSNFDLLLCLENAIFEQRKEYSRAQEPFKTLDVVALIGDCIDRLREYAASKDIQVCLHRSVPRCLVHAQPEALRSAFVNVIHNAIKYTERGSITVKVEVRERQAVSISVEDTGIGISDPHLPGIFERTWQDENNGSQTASKGLGLHLCKGIVEADGGSIECFSRLLEGTRVILSIPIVAEKNPASNFSAMGAEAFKK